MSGIPVARRAEAIGRDPGPLKEALHPENCSPEPKNGVGGMYIFTFVLCVEVIGCDGAVDLLPSRQLVVGRAHAANLLARALLGKFA